MDRPIETKSCADCGALNCLNHRTAYPDFCLTTGTDAQLIEETRDTYINDPDVHRIAIASAQVETDFYGKYTRIQETVEFAKRIGAKKIGLASCVGLAPEARLLAKIFRKHGFEVFGVFCKAGAVEKREIGIDDAHIRTPGDCICNPILQAKLLNQNKTDLNVLVGLCVGHDSLFYKYSEAFVTTLIAKDRVTCHNPAAPLYLTNTFYKHLL